MQILANDVDTYWNRAGILAFNGTFTSQLAALFV